MMMLINDVEIQNDIGNNDDNSNGNDDNYDNNNNSNNDKNNYTNDDYIFKSTTNGNQRVTQVIFFVSTQFVWIKAVGNQLDFNDTLTIYRECRHFLNRFNYINNFLFDNS